MGFWYDGVLQVVRGLPRDQFSLHEVYAASEDLKASRPVNSTPDDTIRRVLQELRRDGVIKFIDGNGHYERIAGTRSEAETETPEEPWPLAVGEKIARKELHSMLGGGSPQGGICTVSGRADVILFSGKGGAVHGYADEGVAEGAFHYVGQGRRGHQEMKGNNRILAESDQLGRPVRVFAGTSGVVTYAGEFVVDEHAFDWTTLRQEGSMKRRRGILFHLLPMQADLSLLPVRKKTQRPGVVVSSSIATLERAWRPLAWSDLQRVKVPDDLGAQSVSRAEFKLQTEFGTWLSGRGDEVQVRSYRVPGGTATPDLVNVTAGEVIEAKRGTTRALIRAAIGQVLDYAMLSRRDGKPLVPAILLPAEPPRDLLELCHSVGVVVWSKADEGFVRAAPTSMA
jgi:hypothetical protein